MILEVIIGYMNNFDEFQILKPINELVLILKKGDITLENVDAIVNAANKQLAPGGGVCGAIHFAAGSGLAEECKQIGYCETGEAKITKGYNLPSKYVIHTVGPVYSGKSSDEMFLRNCYENSLKLAVKNNLTSIAFPSISTGIFGYPIKEASKIALKTITEFLEIERGLEKVIMVLFSENAFNIYKESLKKL